MREQILEILKNEEECGYKGLKRKIKSEHKEELETILRNMELEGEIYLTEDNLYTLFPENFEIGKVQYTKQRNAYITMRDGSIQYLRKECLNGALNYDTVVWNRTNLQIEKILARELSHVVCEVIIKDDIKYLKPFNTVGDFKVRIDSKNMKQLQEKDRIIVDVSLEKMDDYFEGNYLKKIGNADEPGVELKSIAMSNGFATEFSEAALEQLKEIPQKVSSREIAGRLDLRKNQIFTIDGEKTKDMDDAISIKKLENGNYLLGVHIADVSHYIKEGTPLYEEAKDRGTSLYMTDTVIPMLPPELSNGICSLNPHVDRLTLSCIMEIDQNAYIKDYDICLSAINSKIKMSYDKVNEVLDSSIESPVEYRPFEKTLLEMSELSNIITREKEKRGYLRFANTEIELIKDKEGNIQDVEKRKNGSAQEMIENFMVMANTCIATHLGYLEFMPTIYRNHGKPNFDKVNTTIDFIAELGYRLRTANNVNNPLVLQKILQQLSNKEEFPILSTLILRSMQRAEYNTKNIGHFALELPFYTHFTSPIRRFPDLEVHQIIKKHTSLDLEFMDFRQFEKELEEICKHSSLKERQADTAEEDAKRLELLQYIREHLGEETVGFVNNISGRGVEIQTEKGIVGIADVSALGNVQYNEEKRRLVNENHQVVLKVGHHVLLKAIAVDEEKVSPIFAILENLTLKEKEEQKRLEKQIN